MRRDERSMQVKRQLAMARPELREGGNFYYDVNQKMPDDGRACHVRATDSLGSYTLPFPVCRKNDQWLNGDHKLEIQIVAWRYA